MSLLGRETYDALERARARRDGERDRIAACLAACEGLSDPVAALHAVREALKHSEQALASLPVDALGMGHDDNHEWPLRDELLTQVRAAMALWEAK